MTLRFPQSEIGVAQHIRLRSVLSPERSRRTQDSTPRGSTRALVLGATGHIGAHVTRALLANGYAVRATYRTPAHLITLNGLPVERFQLDLNDSGRLREALDGCEWVFHCASFYPQFTDRREAAVARGLQQIRTVFDVFRTAPLQRGGPAIRAGEIFLLGRIRLDVV